MYVHRVYLCRMAESKDVDSQVARVRNFVVLAQLSLEQAGSSNATYDEERDRIVVELAGTTIAEMSYPGVAMSGNDELQQRLVAAIINHFGDHRRRSFVEPEV